ncbi:MAG: glutamine--tRNA ligase, partial [Halioglobus sp.]|nr:glutamine--tRNA ligase [Halioglobus sp.]
MGAPENTAQKTDFIRQRIAADLAQGKYDGRVCTRFPPEPNGYLHIGHAKAICINFGIANDFNGVCNLRFDDTNPETETDEFQRAIKQDIQWLGFSWGDRLFHASDYFQALYDFAEVLINDGKAYVDSLSADEIRQYRGTLTDPGKDSPHRNRSVEENLDLFRRMRAGEFA